MEYPAKTIAYNPKSLAAFLHAQVGIQTQAVVKEGRNWVLRRFQQLRSYRDEIETRNRKEIPYSSRLVPRGLSVAERPQTVFHNAAHL